VTRFCIAMYTCQGKNGTHLVTVTYQVGDRVIGLGIDAAVD